MKPLPQHVIQGMVRFLAPAHNCLFTPDSIGSIFTSYIIASEKKKCKKKEAPWADASEWIRYADLEEAGLTAGAQTPRIWFNAFETAGIEMTITVRIPSASRKE